MLFFVSRVTEGGRVRDQGRKGEKKDMSAEVAGARLLAGVEVEGLDEVRCLLACFCFSKFRSPLKL